MRKQATQKPAEKKLFCRTYSALLSCSPLYPLSTKGQVLSMRKSTISADIQKEGRVADFADFATRPL